jgi:hypothetical protein
MLNLFGNMLKIIEEPGFKAVCDGDLNFLDVEGDAKPGGNALDYILPEYHDHICECKTLEPGQRCYQCYHVRYGGEILPAHSIIQRINNYFIVHAALR